MEGNPGLTRFPVVGCHRQQGADNHCFTLFLYDYRYVARRGRGHVGRSGVERAEQAEQRDQGLPGGILPAGQVQQRCQAEGAASQQSERQWWQLDDRRQADPADEGDDQGRQQMAGKEPGEAGHR